jgi:hypothetical protein
MFPPQNTQPSIALRLEKRQNPYCSSLSSALMMDIDSSQAPMVSLFYVDQEVLVLAPQAKIRWEQPKRLSRVLSFAHDADAKAQEQFEFSVLASALLTDRGPIAPPPLTIHKLPGSPDLHCHSVSLLKFEPPGTSVEPLFLSAFPYDDRSGRFISDEVQTTPQSTIDLGKTRSQGTLLPNKDAVFELHEDSSQMFLIVSLVHAVTRVSDAPVNAFYANLGF